MFALAFHAAFHLETVMSVGLAVNRFVKCFLFFSWQTPQASAHLFFLGCLFLPPMLTLDSHPPQLFVANRRCGDIFLGEHMDQPYDVPSRSLLSLVSVFCVLSLVALDIGREIASSYEVWFVSRTLYFYL